MAATIAWRGTFLDSVAPKAECKPRSSSAPPTQGNRSVGTDLFIGERLYVNALCARAEQLCRQPESKSCLLPSVSKTVSETGSSCRKHDDAFDTSSTTATWTSQVGSDDGDSDDEADEQAFLQNVRKMAEALLLGSDPREVAASSQAAASARPQQQQRPAAASACSKAAAGHKALPEIREEAAPLEVTTLMICDLPCRVLQDQLVETMDAEGFAGTYDWIFVPKSRARSSNPGYAFVNFINPSDAERCVQVFTGYRFSGTSSSKVCSVKPARLQGVEANMAQFGAGRRRRKGGSSK